MRLASTVAAWPVRVLLLLDGVGHTAVISARALGWTVLCCSKEALHPSAFGIECSLREPADLPLAAPHLVGSGGGRVDYCVMMAMPRFAPAARRDSNILKCQVTGRNSK